MTHGITNQNALGQCSCLHSSTDQKKHRSSAPTFNQHVSLAASLDVIKKVVNNLSGQVSSHQNNKQDVKTDSKTTKTMTGGTHNNTTIAPDKEALDDFIFSLIEQLLTTLDKLLGEGHKEQTTGATHHSSTPSGFEINSTHSSPSIISTNTFYTGHDSSTVEKKEQHFEAQLYALIEFMNGVNDNLDEISNDRISGLIGYLEQEYEESKYQNRRDTMVASLILFLEEYRRKSPPPELKTTEA